jgi:hypothetical protein
MDLTNRILIVGAAVLWIFLVLLVILLAWGAPDQSIERLFDLAEYLEDNNNNTTKLIITFGGLILAGLGLLVIVYEMMPPETASLQVTSVGSGDARITTEEIALRLEDEIRALPQVNQVQAVVTGRGKKAEVSLDLHVRPEADLSATTEEACRVARQLVEGRMGVELNQPPKAQLHYRELQITRDAETAASPYASPPASSPPSEPPPASQPAQPEPLHDISGTASEDRPAGA